MLTKQANRGASNVNMSSPQSTMSSLDANVKRVLRLLLPKFHAHREQSPHPMVLGITGLQGSGKSTWASNMVELLASEHGLHAITVSLDDFYHTHENLIVRRDKDPDNKLYRTRGQPGTHDQDLARSTLQALRSWDGEGTSGIAIPVFDKSSFHGEGDRAPRETWPHCSTKPDIVVFEGWCVGFRALTSPTLQSRYAAATSAAPDPSPDCIKTLPDHDLAHLETVNAHLSEYNDSFMGPQHFHLFVHLDTEDLRNVYRWRLQQEHAMWEAKGAGMSDEGVRAFVRGYMPAYELYLEELRAGLFGDGSGRHIRVVMDRERGVERVDAI